MILDLINPLGKWLQQLRSVATPELKRDIDAWLKLPDWDFDKRRRCRGVTMSGRRLG